MVVQNEALHEYRLADIELSQPLPSFVPEPPGQHQLARMGFQFTVRLHSSPLGVVRILTRRSELSADEIAESIWGNFSFAINEHLRADGLMPVSGLSRDGIPSLQGTPSCRAARKEFLERAPLASIVLCTRDRTPVLARCIDSLVGLNYPRFEVIVVDNAPSTDLTRALISEQYSQIPNIYYVREDRVGLSRARNCGLRAARGEIVVYTDDDVLADPDWLAALGQGFEAADRVAAVSGLLLPYKLETPEQVLFEDYAGLGKGFKQRIYDLKQNRPSDPLYPYAAGRFGSGANMAFRTDFLRRIGGFDVALGSGTPTLGGEDLAVFFDTVRAGYQVVYEPSAIIYHDHQCKTMDSLRRQVFGYGSGLTAFLAKCAIDDPRTVLSLAMKVPKGIAYALNPASEKNRGKGPNYPTELTRLELKGMLHGFLAYPRGRWNHDTVRQVARISRPGVG